MPVREEWLHLTQEEALEPDLPICDPHHHLWDRPGDQYLLADVLQDIQSGHNVVRTVFVECSAEYRQEGPETLRPVGETEFVQEVAETREADYPNGPGVAAGIVGFADLTLGSEVLPVLEAHRAASPNRFRGIRHPCAWDAEAGQVSYKSPRPGLMMEKGFRQGFAVLQDQGLSFEAWVYHPQLSEVVDLAQNFDETTIILNHIGGPLGTGSYASQQDAVLAEWKRSMAALAACPNVYVKLGGLGMPRYGHGWHEQSQPPGSEELARSMAPYLTWCIEQFGPERCMFESNFPVDKVSYSYTVLWNAFKRLTATLSPGERTALFHDSAARAYRLPEVGVA